METLEQDFKFTFLHPKKEKREEIKELLTSEANNLRFYLQDFKVQRYVGIHGKYYGIGLF